jgi:hypothetical protein
MNLHATGGRQNPLADPFEVSAPERLSPEETLELERENNPAKAVPGEKSYGRVLCAYRIRVSLREVARDGKTPFDIGPFYRRVTISDPDIPGEPKQVIVQGLVRGIVEIGNDGEINFTTFRSSQGKKVTLSLQSTVPGLTLSFDEKRTSKFLVVNLRKADATIDGQQSWTLDVSVPPDKVFGTFPRPDHPLYEDSAVYLKASSPGKPDRAIRISVQGTANQG